MFVKNVVPLLGLKTGGDMLYPIGIQNFEDLRKGGYVYVDKTAVIHHPPELVAVIEVKNQ